MSEFELLAALRENVPVELLLVNGIGKAGWLRKCSIEGLQVNCDSVEEVYRLAGQSAALNWRVGLRYQPTTEMDIDEPSFPTQFGMDALEIKKATQILARHGVNVAGIQFHLRTNVARVSAYREAMGEVLEIIGDLRMALRYLDVGGGWPVSGEFVTENEEIVPTTREFDIGDFWAAIQDLAAHASHPTEVWLENGRFITGPACVLVMNVVDIKYKENMRYLICDAGRTNQALVSDWEIHPIAVLERRSASPEPTTVCGPTCMAFDKFGRYLLPGDIQIGDRLMWFNAGAYHTGWQGGFSHGKIASFWLMSNGSVVVERAAEPFERWWPGTPE